MLAAVGRDHDDVTRDGVASPAALPGLPDPARIGPGDLFGGTVAHIVRAYGDYRITVSERVPRGLHAAAAAHLMESHVRECYAPHCAVGRAFLPAPLPAAGVG